MQDMYANSNEGIFFQTRNLVAGKNETLESSPRLGLICFKTFDLNLIYPGLFSGP